MVEIIGANAFSGCSNLKTAKIKGSGSWKCVGEYGSSGYGNPVVSASDKDKTADYLRWEYVDCVWIKSSYSYYYYS